MVHPDFVLAGIAVRMEVDGEKEKALDELDLVPFASARVEALQQMARRQITAQQFEDAVELLNRSSEAAREIEHVEERIRSICDNATLYIAAKRNDLAVETFAAAKTEAETVTNVHRDYFLGTAALGFLTAGSPDLAEQTLDQMTDKTHISATLLGMARHVWTSEREEALGLLEEAFEILESQADFETRDSRSRNVLWTSIATQFAGFGKTDRGLEIAALNPDPDERTNAVNQICAILAQQKEFELARATALSLEEPADRAAALVAAADAAAEHNEKVESGGLLREAREVANQILQAPAKASTLSAIVLRSIDDERTAAEALEAALEAACEIRDESRQAAVVAELSQAEGRGVALTGAARASLNKMLAAAER
jgi:hypothetical protein